MIFVTGSSFVYFKSQPNADKVVPIVLTPESFPPPEEKAEDITQSPPPVEAR
jgi:hypothetical protein